MPTRVRLLLLLMFLLTLPTILPLATPARADACHGNVFCQDPKSCGTWSTYILCDTPYCEFDSFCVPKSGGDATFNPRERFRDCTLQNGSHCREYEYSEGRVCGCH